MKNPLKSTRRILSRASFVAVILAGAVAVAGCAPVGSASIDRSDYKGPALPQEILDRGHLIAAMDAETPPGRFTDESDKLTGWEVELTKLIAERLMIPVEFTITPFDSMLPGVQAKRYDMAVGSFDAYYFPERLAAHDFVTYFKSPGSTLLIAKDNPSSVPDTEFCGFRIGAIRGSYDAGLVEEESKRCVDTGQEAVVDGGTVYPGSSAAVLALKSDRLDAVMSDYAMNAYQVAVLGDEFEAIGMYGEPGEYSIGFYKGAVELTEAVRWALQSLIDDGTYLTLMAEWGVEGGAIKTAEVLTEAG